MSPYTAPGAQFLGQTTPIAAASANSTGVLVFGPGWGKLFIYHYIAGYTGGGGIARLRFGTGTTVDNAANYSAITQRFVSGSAAAAATFVTASIGFPVANTAVTSGRRGLHEVWNPASGHPKFIDSRTLTYTGNPTTSAAVHSSLDFVCGNWWNNAQAQCVDMYGGTEGRDLVQGSYLTVYGIPGQG